MTVTPFLLGAYFGNPKETIRHRKHSGKITTTHFFRQWEALAPEQHRSRHGLQDTRPSRLQAAQSGVNGVARDHEYKHQGTLSLLAGISLLTGDVHPASCYRSERQ